MNSTRPNFLLLYWRNGAPKIRVGQEILFYFLFLNTREVVRNICTPKDIWMQECTHTHTQTSPHLYKHASVDTFHSHSRVDPISYDKQKSARLTENRTCGAAIKIQKTQQSLPRRGREKKIRLQNL